jgi:hypothetical protein
MKQDVKHSNKNLKTIFVLIFIIFFLAGVSYKLVQYKLNSTKTIENNQIASVPAKSEESITAKKDEDLAIAPKAPVALELQGGAGTPNNSELRSICKLLNAIKMDFISGNSNQEKIKEINLLLRKEKITPEVKQISNKSIFDIVEDFNNSKIDIFKEEDLSLSSGRALVARLYYLISSQFYIERLQMTSSSTEMEIRTQEIENDLKKFEFTAALEKSEKLINKSAIFDQWLVEFKLFFEQIKTIELIERERNG